MSVLRLETQTRHCQKFSSFLSKNEIVQTKNAKRILRKREIFFLRIHYVPVRPKFLSVQFFLLAFNDAITNTLEMLSQ